MSQANDGKSDRSSKSDMFNLPDPDWMIDGRKDPAKAERRREAAKRAAETRARNSQTPGSVSARGIDESRMNTPLGTGVEMEREAPPPIPQPVPPLSFGTVQGGFEGQHALLQPAEIRREPHEPARQAARQPSPVENTNNNRPGADETLLVRSPGTGTNTMRETSETLRGEDIQNQGREDQTSESPTRSDRTRHSRQSATSTSSKHSEEIKKMAEAIKDLQRELATVRSRRSSLASPSRSESRTEIREIERFKERRESSGMEGLEAPRQRTWAEMDEI